MHGVQRSARDWPGHARLSMGEVGRKAAWQASGTRCHTLPGDMSASHIYQADLSSQQALQQSR